MIKLDIHKKLNAPNGEMSLEVEVDIEAQSFTTLYGKSGAGKTSLLRILCGLMTPEEGQIMVNGTTWFNKQKGINWSPQKRKVGYVFQDYALFPNMSVWENLNFALEKGQNPKGIEELIDLIELGDLQNLKPELLSGGQKQRVALARALVQKPSILLLDEPLSALDNEMRYKLQTHLLNVHREFKLTTILISHDLSEIRKMSDRVLELDQGKIIREGKPESILKYQRIGDEIQLSGKLIDIKKEGLNVVFIIQVGENTIEINLNEIDDGSLEIGETLFITFDSVNTVISKRPS